MLGISQTLHKHNLHNILKFNLQEIDIIPMSGNVYFVNNSKKKIQLVSMELAFVNYRFEITIKVRNNQ